MRDDYVHGYSHKETKRLNDQAMTLSELLHHDSLFPENVSILEAGCGVGAQSIILAQKNPKAQITSMDISAESIKKAQEKIQAHQIKNVTFLQGDIFNLPFEKNSFDHIFICFVLEHLHHPEKAIKQLLNVLKPGGSFTIIEGDHGSAYFYPESKWAKMAIECQVSLQAQSGGNTHIGRSLYPLMSHSGLNDIQVTPRMVYADASRPLMVEGFTKNTFTAMIEGVRESALENGLIDETVFDLGIKDLYRTAEKDGVFCYTFFKGKGFKSNEN